MLGMENYVGRHARSVQFNPLNISALLCYVLVYLFFPLQGRKHTFTSDFSVCGLSVLSLLSLMFSLFPFLPVYKGHRIVICVQCYSALCPFLFSQTFRLISAGCVDISWCCGNSANVFPVCVFYFCHTNRYNVDQIQYTVDDLNRLLDKCSFAFAKPCDLNIAVYQIHSNSPV